jgi:hypothetical protein
MRFLHHPEIFTANVKRMSKEYWLFVVLSVFGIIVHYPVSAQQIVPVIEWERRHFGSSPAVHNVFTLAQTSDGGYILGGWFLIFQVELNCLLVKIDSRGEVLWERKYGGSGDESIRFIRHTSDGGYVFAGPSTSPVSRNKEAPHFGGEDVWVVKVDAQGNKQWERSFGGAGDDSPAGLWQVPDGYLLATKASTVSGDGGFWLIKLDPQGEQEWKRSLAGESQYFRTAIERAKDGGFVFAGASGNGASPFGGQDGLLMKVDAQGAEQWVRFFGGTDFDSLHSIVMTPDGGFIVGGLSQSPPSGNKESARIGSYDYWIVKVDVAGNKLWDRTYRTYGSGGHLVLPEAADPGYVFGGSSGDRTAAVKIDPQGRQQWEVVVDDRGNDYLLALNDLQPTRDGGYIMGGGYEQTNVGAPGAGGAWVAKLERVVSRAGEVVTWKTNTGAVLEIAEDLNGEWKADQSAVLSIGEASAVALMPAGQQRFYRLRAPDASSGAPALASGGLLSWPVTLNQTLEISTAKDGPWQTFSGDQGALGETRYAVVPQSLQRHYFRTRRVGP